MNIFYKLSCAVFLTAAFASCSKNGFLDSKSTSSLNKKLTFSDSANTMDYLAGLYIDLSFNFPLSNNSADFSKMSDEAEGRYPALGNFDKVVTQGTFAGSLYSAIGTQYSTFYKDIHNINVLLENLDSVPLSGAKKIRVKAEARFLRAFYYSWLTKYFGGVPLVGDKVYEITDESTLERSTYEKCVDYMVSELDAAAADLPLSYSGLDYGRITKGACLALKSRVLLFAASPLYNGGSPATTETLKALTSYPTYDAARWEKARIAAQAVMNLPDAGYALNVDNTTKWSVTTSQTVANLPTGYGFYKLFITRVNPEYILPRPLPTGKQVETQMNPKSRGGANYYYYPTQELVDMFPTAKGLAITDDIYNATTNPTGYNANNPYQNRDPRLTATVVYNGGQLFINSTRTLAEVNTYVGAANDGIVAISSNGSTITGYYMRKMCDELGVVTGGNNVDRSLPIIRYAEILLNYAEATNETGNTTEALNTLIPLRQRAGIVPGANNRYGIPATATQDQARTLIQNERAIELAYEQHRLWDIRRWKINNQIDSKILHGMQITRTGTTTPAVYTYKRIEVRNHYFKDVYLYWPIPLDEVTLSGGKILQNPGY